MEGVNITVRFSGQCIVPNENGELEFESGAGTKTQIHAEEVERVNLYSQSKEDFLSYLAGSGAYIGEEDSKVIVITAANGTTVYSKDEPSRKIVLDKNIPETAIQQILDIDDFDDGRAVEKILIENKVIEEPEKEADQVITSDRVGISVEHEAENVDSRDITDGGMIGEARSARAETEIPYNGEYTEEHRRAVEDERLRKIREERANGKADGPER